MTIAFQCPACNKQHRVNDSLAGKQARCSCGKVIAIPPVGESSDAGAPSAWDKLLTEAATAQQTPSPMWPQAPQGAFPAGHQGTTFPQAMGPMPGGYTGLAYSPPMSSGELAGYAPSRRVGELPTFVRTMLVIDACLCMLRAPLTLVNVLHLLSGGRALPGLPAGAIYASIAFAVLIVACELTGNIVLLKKLRWALIPAGCAVVAAGAHLICMDIISHRRHGEEILPTMITWDAFWVVYHGVYIAAILLAARKLWGNG